jgi:hypothetical protein
LICATIRDAAVPVRVNGRACYWSFHARFPEAAQKLMAEKIDEKTKKLIIADKDKIVTPEVPRK